MTWLMTDEDEFRRKHYTIPAWEMSSPYDNEEEEKEEEDEELD